MRGHRCVNKQLLLRFVRIINLAWRYKRSFTTNTTSGNNTLVHMAGNLVSSAVPRLNHAHNTRCLRAPLETCGYLCVFLNSFDMFLSPYECNDVLSCSSMSWAGIGASVSLAGSLWVTELNSGSQPAGTNISSLKTTGSGGWETSGGRVSRSDPAGLRCTCGGEV